MTKAQTNKQMPVIQQGDVVKIENISPFKGMLGEVVDVYPNGLIAVRVAHIHVDMPTRTVKKDIRTVTVGPENVTIDQEATAAVRSGHGGIIIR